MKTVTLNQRQENYFPWPFATFTGGFVRSINCLNRNMVYFAVTPSEGVKLVSRALSGGKSVLVARWLMVSALDSGFFGRTFHEFYAGGNDAMD